MGVKTTLDQLNAWKTNNPHLKITDGSRPARVKVGVPEHGERTYAMHPDSLRELREAKEPAPVPTVAPRKSRAKKAKYAVCATPGRSWTFTYAGPMVSMNATYAGLHWRKRKDMADKWHHTFLDLLAEAQMQKVEALRLHLRYNSRHDVDNLVLPAKLLIDCMKGEYLPDDTKQHYRGIQVAADETLPHNTFIFTLTELLP